MEKCGWISGVRQPERRVDTGFLRCCGTRKFGMIFGCLLHRSQSTLATHIDFPVFDPVRCFAVCLAIVRRASSRSFGAQKNGLQQLWDGALRLVRPRGTSSTRSVQRGYAHLSRIRGAAGRLPQLCAGETRATRVPRRQHALHRTLCLPCRPALSCRCVHAQTILTAAAGLTMGMPAKLPRSRRW